MRTRGASIAVVLTATATSTLLNTTASDAAGATPVAAGSAPAPEQPLSPSRPSKPSGFDALAGFGILDFKALEDTTFVFWLGAGRIWDRDLVAHLAWVGGGVLLLGASSFGIDYDLQLRGGLRFGGPHNHVMGFAATGGDRYGMKSDGGVVGNSVALGAYACGGLSARLGNSLALRAETAWCARTGDDVDHEARFEVGIELGSWDLSLHLSNYYRGNDVRFEGFSFFVGKAI